MDAYTEDDGTGTTTRSHATERVLLGTITNNGEVDATLTLTFSDIEVTLGSASYGDGLSYAKGAVSGTPQVTDVEGLFTLNIYTQETDGEALTLTDGDGVKTYTTTLEVSGTKAISLYVEVVWTSADKSYYESNSSNHAAAEALADALDTWVGENVTKISWDVSYTAVQASESPVAA